MREYGFCCNAKRYSNFCPNCGKEIIKSNPWTIDSLKDYLAKRATQDTGRNKEKWNAWLREIFKLLDQISWEETKEVYVLFEDEHISGIFTSEEAAKRYKEQDGHELSIEKHILNPRG